MAGVNYNNTTKKPAVSNGEVDIDVSTPPIDGQVLVYDSASGKYIPGNASGGGSTLFSKVYELTHTGIAQDFENTTYVQANFNTPTFTLTETKTLTSVVMGSIQFANSGFCDMAYRLVISNNVGGATVATVDYIGVHENGGKQSGDWDRVNHQTAEFTLGPGTYDVEIHIARVVSGGTIRGRLTGSRKWSVSLLETT